MDAQKIQVKLFCTGSEALELDPYIVVFHRWIRERVLDELMIDVADYQHVHHGPGVVLVGHASDYYLDLGEGRPGLLYSRKRQGPKAEERLQDALRRALSASYLLQNEPGLEPAPRFGIEEILFKFPERLKTPNNPELQAQAEAQVSALFSKLVPEARLSLQAGDDDARAPLSVRAKLEGAPELSTLLDRVGGPIAAG